MHFDEAYCYNKKDLKPQDFAQDEEQEEDDAFFAELTNIYNASKPNSELDTISQKNSDTYPYFDELRSSSSFMDI